MVGGDSVNLARLDLGAHAYLSCRADRSPFRARVHILRRPKKARDRGVFVNSGRMFLEGFDYLYDAAGGYRGVTPGLSYAP